MEGQRNELLEIVDKNGWKSIKLDNYDFHKWSMETWLLESVWSLVGTTAYVSFLIDEMCDLQDPFAWAIKISDQKPSYGKGRSDFTVSLKQWKNEKQEILNFLEQIRNAKKPNTEK
jgi:hypothetical protein